MRALPGLMLAMVSIATLACGNGGAASTPELTSESSTTTAPTASVTATATKTARTMAQTTEDRPHPSPLPEGEGTQRHSPLPEGEGTAPSASPTSTATADGEAATAGPVPLVDPDPNYQDALDAVRFRTGVWRTDFSLHTVPYDEFLSGGVPRDGIPPLDDPQFDSIGDADRWLDDVQPVVSLEINGAARAYPLAILTWHEIANDELGGVPVSVTFCPLCNSAVAFDRRVGDAVLDFGVSGNLRNSDLVMWDRQTESWWQQLTGEGIVGAYAGYQLDLAPAQIVSWGDFKRAFPDADVLSRETGYARAYGSNPYSGYDRIDQSPFLFEGRPDERLLPMERVAALALDGRTLAFPFTTLEEERVVNYSTGERDIVVLFQPGTASALDRQRIAESRDVGSIGVFETELDGQSLTFRLGADGFVDEQTGSVWNVLGQAVSGPLAGKSLTPIVHGNHFWFAWAAFAPETEIYRGR